MTPCLAPISFTASACRVTMKGISKITPPGAFTFHPPAPCAPHRQWNRCASSQ
jgi:hypothetical protein